MDLCIKLEKITNRTFALSWKNFSEERDLCIKLEKNCPKGIGQKSPIRGYDS